LLGAGACGVTPFSDGGSLVPLSPRRAVQRPADRPLVVSIRWDAVPSGLYPHQAFPPIDLGRFQTPDGASLSDVEAVLHERVREEVAVILGGVTGVEVFTSAEPAEPGEADTTVLMTQGLSPEGRTEIGRADYDPCDRYLGDEAVIFGEQILRLGNGYPLDEWVTLFSNVCAHEVAHTLGFGHVRRVDALAEARPAYVELMLDAHTMAEMRRPQRVLMDQDRCREAAGTQAVRAAAPARVRGCGR
jgi:hypothetical protein